MLLDDDQCIPYPPHYNIHLDPGLTCSNNHRFFRLYHEENFQPVYPIIVKEVILWLFEIAMDSTE